MNPVPVNRTRDSIDTAAKTPTIKVGLWHASSRPINEQKERPDLELEACADPIPAFCPVRTCQRDRDGSASESFT